MAKRTQLSQIEWIVELEEAPPVIARLLALSMFSTSWVSVMAIMFAIPLVDPHITAFANPNYGPMSEILPETAWGWTMLSLGTGSLLMIIDRQRHWQALTWVWGVMGCVWLVIALCHWLGAPTSSEWWMYMGFAIIMFSAWYSRVRYSLDVAMALDGIEQSLNKPNRHVDDTQGGRHGS